MKRDFRLIPGRFLSFILSVVAAWLLLVPGMRCADTLEGAARELAGKIAAALSPQEAAAVSVRNLSSLTAVEVAVVRRALEVELASHPRADTRSESAVRVDVTLSENLQGYLWVAEIHRAGAERQVEMLVLSKSVLSGTGRRDIHYDLEKERVWEQDEQILDLAFGDAPEGGGHRMVVLTPSRVTVYERKGEQWEVRQTLALAATPLRARDLRGRLEQSNPIVAHLPGLRCTGELPGNLRCQANDQEDDVWLLGDPHELRLDASLVRDRNFFHRASFVLRAGESLPPFFSAVVFRVGAEVLRAFAGVDGSTRIYGDAGALLATIPGWGSDLAGVRSDCGGGWQLLATPPGDWTEPDAVQAYEMLERDVVAVSAPVEFPGPVTALWPGPNFATAVGVARNLKTGRYEAYRLSISCGR